MLIVLAIDEVRLLADSGEHGAHQAGAGGPLSGRVDQEVMSFADFAAGRPISGKQVGAPAVHHGDVVTLAS